MTEYTPLSRFRKFVSRVSELSKAFGDDLQERGFKPGGTAGQVPIKTNGTDFNWSWGNYIPTTNANLTGVVTSVGNATSIADGALSVAKTSGLQGILDGKASKWTSIITVSANYTITTDDDVVLVNTTGGSRTISLPAAATVTGLSVLIKKISVDANVVTIDGNAAETIDGDPTEILTAQWQMVRIKSNGTAWFVVGEFTP